LAQNFKIGNTETSRNTNYNAATKTIREHSLPEEEEMKHDDDAGDGQPEDDRQPSQPTSSSAHK
jgi:hypothetical protein